MNICEQIPIGRDEITGAIIWESIPLNFEVPDDAPVINDGFDPDDDCPDWYERATEQERLND